MQTWTANSRIRLNTAGATAGVSTMDLLAENGNRILIQGQDGQGIDVLNNQIAINGVTTFNNTVSATTFTGNLSGTASNASNIALVSDNTNGTYFIPFSKTVGSSNVFYVDDLNTPLTYNPNTS